MNILKYVKIKFILFQSKKYDNFVKFEFFNGSESAVRDYNLKFTYSGPKDISARVLIWFFAAIKMHLILKNGNTILFIKKASKLG